jgi:hypothetical protein
MEVRNVDFYAFSLGDKNKVRVWSKVGGKGPDLGVLYKVVFIGTHY